MAAVSRLLKYGKEHVYKAEIGNPTWATLLLMFGAHALDKNNALLEKIGGATWEFDFHDDTVMFKKHGWVKVQTLGSYYRNHKQWVWSWSSQDVIAGKNSKRAALRMLSLGEKYNIDRLTLPYIECSKSTAHNIAFVASGCLPSSGYFALELGGNTRFVLLDKSFLGFHTSASRMVQIFRTFIKTQPENHKAAFINYVKLNGFKCDIGMNYVLAKRGRDQLMAVFDNELLLEVCD